MSKINSNVVAATDQLSADEIALYDRQIRLWGMGTQLRLRSAKLLIVNFGAIALEVVKNLVLGGINSIEILDCSKVRDEDFAGQFFLPNDDSIIGQVKLPLVLDSIKELNNRVDVTIDTESLDTKLAGSPDYFSKFDLIICTELTKSQILKFNDLTRALNIPLYISGMHGMFGYILADLIEHTCVNEKDVGNQPRKPDTDLNPNKTIIKVELNKAGDKEVLTIRDKYETLREVFVSKKLPGQLTKRQLKKLTPALPFVLSLLEFENREIVKEEVAAKATQMCETLELPPTIITQDYIEHFANQAFTEFAPICAVLGGALAQDVIQFLSRKESPINNCLIFDGLRSEMPIYTL